MTTAPVLSPPAPPLPAPSTRPAVWPADLPAIRPGKGQSGTLGILLAEFGKTLADTDLDCWLEAFADRNSAGGHTYAISGKGVLLIMPPTGHPGVIHEMKLVVALDIWTDENGGVAFPATARFILPDGSRFGPDAAWVREERRAELLDERNRPFPQIVPDFIAEIQSPSNSREELVDKISLFLRYGTRLAWLLDAAAREVIKFRPGQEPEVLYDPEFVDGDEDVLPGFRFDVRARMFDFMTGAG